MKQKQNRTYKEKERDISFVVRDQNDTFTEYG